AKPERRINEAWIFSANGALQCRTGLRDRTNLGNRLASGNRVQGGATMSTKRGVWVLVCCVAFCGSALGQSPASLPAQGRVNDFAGVLDAGSKSRLQAVIDQLERDTGAEIAVVTIQDAGPQTPKELAGTLFNSWGVGKRDKNNGLMILLALQQRRIET